MAQGTKISVNVAHELFGHGNKDLTRRTAQEYGWNIQVKMEVCEACCEAKGKQKNVPKAEKLR